MSEYESCAIWDDLYSILYKPCEGNKAICLKITKAIISDGSTLIVNEQLLRFFGYRGSYSTMKIRFIKLLKASGILYTEIRDKKQIRKLYLAIDVFDLMLISAKFKKKTVHNLLREYLHYTKKHLVQTSFLTTNFLKEINNMSNKIRISPIDKNAAATVI